MNITSSELESSSVSFPKTVTELSSGICASSVMSLASEEETSSSSKTCCNMMMPWTNSASLKSWIWEASKTGSGCWYLCTRHCDRSSMQRVWIWAALKMASAGWCCGTTMALCLAKMGKLSLYKRRALVSATEPCTINTWAMVLRKVMGCGRINCHSHLWSWRKTSLHTSWQCCSKACWLNPSWNLTRLEWKQHV